MKGNSRGRRRSMNAHLGPPLTFEQICKVLVELTERNAERAVYGRRWYGSFPASVIAAEGGVEGAKRLGKGAVKGSWSGSMSAALRVAPTLRAMERAGLVYRFYDPESHRALYGLNDSGRALAKGE